MNIKPILTYCGSTSLLECLEGQIISSLPSDTTEWKRSYGRHSKNVRLEAVFKKFDINLLRKYQKGEWSILEHPVLHIFISECNDIETYKISVKEEIDLWMKGLNEFGVTDWMILLVETLDIRKTKNLLPRTTVLDKIRIDFGTKNEDRCISVLNPLKFEQKATESFRCLVQRIRSLMLSSYNKNITKYEELIRVNREKRNHDGWNFMSYFILQEDLALVFEKLGLYKEALVQYDELEVVFSQFINSFIQNQNMDNCFKMSIITQFQGIILNRSNELDIRQRIQTHSLTLLEFRNYLFERQAHLLQLCQKSVEIVERLLTFLLSTLHEIDVIKSQFGEGSLACWQLLCALEVLQFCDRSLECTDISYFKDSASIWNLAKEKFYELGKLCGLLPGTVQTCEQIHIVVQLSAGIGDSQIESVFPDATPQIEIHRKQKKRPIEQLKEALGSAKSFTVLYLELSELTISTYKHISWHRSARRVGLELGKFYSVLNEPHKAVIFFSDIVRELKSEKWNCLCSQTLIDLGNCYKEMNDSISYKKTCAAIACCSNLEMPQRMYYFDEFLRTGILCSETDNNLNKRLTALEDHFKICDIQMITNETIVIQLKLECNFPRTVVVDNISISYEISQDKEDTLNCKNYRNDPIRKLSVHLDYQQDGSLSSASVAFDTKSVRQQVRRSSSMRRKPSPISRGSYANNLVSGSVALQPGFNFIDFIAETGSAGIWNFKQILIIFKDMEYVSDNIPFKLSPSMMTTKSAKAVLSCKNLIAGIQQPANLIVSGGSFIFPEDATMTLHSSKKLRFRLKGDANQPFENDIKISLSNFKSFEERIMPLEMITELPGRRNSKSIEHKVSLSCPWSGTILQIPMHFTPAIVATCRLHTCGTKKYLQVCLKGIDVRLFLTNAEMNCNVEGISIIDLNLKTKKIQEIYKNLTASYIWEIQVEPLKTENELEVVKVQFSTNYSCNSAIDGFKSTYSCAFDVQEYTTLFKMQVHLNSTELCRVRSVCSLKFHISKVQDNPYVDLMYEVLTDQNLWAVCGRSAGVVSMKGVNEHTILLDVMPLNTGFLPMPSVRLSKYISAHKDIKSDTHPKLQPFPPGQVYNSTKGMQVHVFAGNVD